MTPPRIAARRRVGSTLLAGLIIAGGLLACPTAQAQQASWPRQPIRLVVPFAPGGPADALARFIAARLGPELGQTMIVENRAGAGGTLGAAEVAKSSDSHTLLFSSTGALVIIPAITKNVNYNPDRDLVAIGLAVNTPQVVVVAAKSPYASLSALLAAAKAKPGALNFASAGNGTTTQLGAELLKRSAGVSITHIPYRGAAPAIADVIGGTVDMMVADAPAVSAFITDNRLRALAVTSADRVATLPRTPTTGEEGLPDVISGTWYGIMGPAKMPHDVVERINASLNRVLRMPEVDAFIKGQGADPRGGSAQEFASFIRNESLKWGKLAEQAGVRMD
ncbi:Bug family tripartite tricarboxylate transporter substrate binding protein [Achromobacter insuavis]|uniref:Bug family tripartite tricarboxylate transporter substrate binding protein n=1 Tax=Achromobacter insuavis TaxID=1287735 RepID=UPI0009FBCBEF|nr:tripartite tricarboxylate transporter substrate-binding protein [Achromobacter insuavis]